MPKRIQRKRARGWRMPPTARYVGRPGRWGNPWVPGMFNGVVTVSLEASLIQYRAWAESIVPSGLLLELRGHDLVCWCPLVDTDGNPVPCHADVLLELANA